MLQNLGQISKYLCESDDSEYSNDSKMIQVVKNILTVLKVSFKVMKDVRRPLANNHLASRHKTDVDWKQVTSKPSTWN
jgi:hypothetical protein